MERAYVTLADQKIPDWLIKITFLRKVETAFKLNMTSGFGVMGFSTSDAILGLWFSLPWPYCVVLVPLRKGATELPSPFRLVRTQQEDPIYEPRSPH